MAQAGWYVDRQDPALARWHDGTGWTDHTMVRADWVGPGAPPPPGEPTAGLVPPPPPPQDTSSAQGVGPPRTGWDLIRRDRRIGIVIVAVLVLAAVVGLANRHHDDGGVASGSGPDDTGVSSDDTGTAAPLADQYLALMALTPETATISDSDLLHAGRDLCAEITGGDSVDDAWVQWTATYGASDSSNHLFQAVLTGTEDNGTSSLCSDHADHFDQAEAWLNGPQAAL